MAVQGSTCRSTLAPVVTPLAQVTVFASGDLAPWTTLYTCGGGATVGHSARVVAAIPARRTGVKSVSAAARARVRALEPRERTASATGTGTEHGSMCLSRAHARRLSVCLRAATRGPRSAAGL